MVIIASQWNTWKYLILKPNFFVILFKLINFKNGCLRKLLNSKKSFSLDQVFEWSKNIIYGLDYLNEKKIIHRDIKPELELKLKLACIEKNFSTK